MPDGKSPPFIPKKHRDGAEIAGKREGWGTLKYMDWAAYFEKNPRAQSFRSSG